MYIHTDVHQLAPHHPAGGEADVPHRGVDDDGRLAPQLEDAGGEVLRGRLFSFWVGGGKGKGKGKGKRGGVNYTCIFFVCMRYRISHPYIHVSYFLCI